MPSTYTLNNGIELIGTGEQSGTWGDTTNTNFELLDTALDGQVSVTLAATGSSGSPNTLPISDGASSNGRNRLVIFGDGGDLGGTAFVQLTPNDSEKIIYVRNNLSGSRSILLFQGTYSASNDYEVPAGTTAVVFFNGAGTGAVAANVFNNAFFDSLRLGSVSVTAILDEDNMASDSATALATQQSIKAYVDTQVGANNELSEVLANGNTTGGTDIAVSSGDDITFADSSKAIFGAGSDLQIYHDGTRSYVDDTGAGSLWLRGGDVQIKSTTSETMAVFANNGAVTLYYDNSPKLATTNTGVDITGTLTSDGLTVENTSGATLNVNTGLVGADSKILLHEGSTASPANGASIRYAGATNEFSIGVGSSVDTKRISIARDTGDISFYEDTGTTPKFFWDASAESLGIGTTSPSEKITIQSGNLNFSGGTNDAQYIKFGDTDDADIGNIFYYHGNNNMVFTTNAAEAMRIDSSGNVGIGTSSPSSLLDVAGNATVGTNTGGILNVKGGSATSSQVRFFDGGTGRARIGVPTGQTYLSLSGSDTLTADVVIDSSGNVGIGTSSPVSKIDIVHTGNTRMLLSEEATDTSTISTVNTANSAYSDLNVYANNLKLSTNATERMRIDSSGNVGIGTSSPTSTASAGPTLEISGTAGGNLVLSDSNATTGQRAKYFLSQGGTLYIGHSADDGTSPVNDLVIDSSGNVGIGTSSPDQTLHVFKGNAGAVASASNAVITIENSSDAYLQFLTPNTAANQIRFGDVQDNGSGIIEYNHNSAYMSFSTNGPERMRIDSSGNLFIGKTAESATTAGWQFKQSGEAIVGRVANDTIFVFQNSTTGSTVGSISITGSSTAYNTSSDYRLKEDVQPMVGATDRVLALNPVNFAWKADGTRVDGFLAHEAQAVVPEAVTGTHNEVDDDGNAVMQGIDQSKLVPLLTAALKEAITKIETLETEMTSVKARLDALEGA